MNNAGSDDQLITEFEFNTATNEVYIALEDGGQDTIDLTSLNNTGSDDQQLSFSQDTLFLEDGGKVYLGDYLDNTDDQLISLSGDTLYLEDGGQVFLGDYLDNTDDQQITQFEFNPTTNEVYIGLEDGGVDTLDLAALNYAGSDDQLITEFGFNTATNEVYIALEDGGQDTINLSSLDNTGSCLLYTSPSPRDLSTSRMPSSA